MMIHHMGYRLRGPIHRFSGKLCNGMGNVSERFVKEMLYGKKARGSVGLSEVARSREEKISLKKVIERLSRNRGRRGLAEGIGEAVLKEGAVKGKEDTLLIVDPTDITKKYAKKIEYLAQVRDGSDKLLAMGYGVNTVVGAEAGSSEITPLVHKLYSQNVKQLVNENQEMIDAVTAKSGTMNCWEILSGVSWCVSEETATCSTVAHLVKRSPSRKAARHPMPRQ